MMDYAKLKVPDLRDALQKRSLPTNGVKSDLIARLVASDAALTPAPTVETPKAAAHLPTADDYEVDWEDNDETIPAAASTTSTTTAAPATFTAATSAPKTEIALTAVAAAPAAAPPQPEKPKKKSIAALFDAPAKTNSPSSPSTVTDDNTSSNTPAAATTTAAEQSFTAGLKSSDAADELAKKRKRAERFGVPDAESTKMLERAKKFGAVENADLVKGLDVALPEKKERKRGREGADVGKGNAGKRQRDARRDNNGRDRKRGRRGQGNNRSNNGAAGGTVRKNILDDPAEKAKAEARARKFGAAAK